MLQRIFLNDKITFLVIIINAIAIFAIESGISNPLFTILDVAAIAYFAIEMAVKHAAYGVRGYWHNGWNCFDGILLILSLPSLVCLFIDLKMVDLSVLLTFRLLRVIRFFRVLHIFPGFNRMMKAMKLAISQCYSFLCGFAVVVIIFGLLNCALFRDVAPEFFGSPTTAIYSIFRLCTVEGWYEIPDSLIINMPDWSGGFIRFYFSLLLILGGIIGMSFINSIFVDAMVADNNDELEKKIDRLSEQIERLESALLGKDNTNR